MNKKAEKLNKEELKEILGGAASFSIEAVSAAACIKINRNRVDKCECLYKNFGITYNINKLDACKCTCIEGNPPK
jgi:hypothetical protein